MRRAGWKVWTGRAMALIVAVLALALLGAWLFLRASLAHVRGRAQMTVRLLSGPGARTFAAAATASLQPPVVQSPTAGASVSGTAYLRTRAADAARESLAGGLTVASNAGGEPGRQLMVAAQDAFLSGMHTAAIVAGAIAVAGALVALVWLPAREKSGEAVAELEIAPERELVPA